MGLQTLNLVSTPWRRVSAALAVIACLLMASVQASDSGPRRRAEGHYDATSSTYTVARGDNLDAIAERFGIGLTELKAVNKRRSDRIEVGQRLIVSTAAQAKAAGKLGTGTSAAGDIGAIAEDAYLYGFPMIVGYDVLYKYFIDRSSGQFKAPIGQIHNEARVYTPKGYRHQHAQQRHALLDGVPRPARGAHGALHARDREAPLLRRAARRSLHRQLRLHG
jgi:LysM repeat protein